MLPANGYFFFQMIPNYNPPSQHNYYRALSNSNSSIRMSFDNAIYRLQPDPFIHTSSPNYDYFKNSPIPPSPRQQQYTITNSTIETPKITKSKRLRQKSPSPASSVTSSSSSSSRASSAAATGTKKRRGNLPRQVTEVLRVWLNSNLQHPYPTDEEKAQLMKETGLTLNQISNWFINARRRRIPALNKSMASK